MINSNSLITIWSNLRINHNNLSKIIKNNKICKTQEVVILVSGKKIILKCRTISKMEIIKVFYSIQVIRVLIKF